MVDGAIYYFAGAGASKERLNDVQVLCVGPGNHLTWSCHGQGSLGGAAWPSRERAPLPMLAV